jgi:DNA-binding IclR family transcriptional regulator
VTDDLARALIRTVIRSVWGLELMLLMRRQPDRVWPVTALVQELRASPAIVEPNLRQLVQGGMVREEADGFVYGPASPLLEEACAALERAYRERPVAIINLIVGASGDSVQGFADAFKFKRGDD